MKTYAYGFPRLGRAREFKKAVESFWKESLSEAALFHTLSAIQKENLKTYQDSIDLFPEGEMTFYDPMLDTAIACGVYDPKNLNEYYELCRGASALRMTKWFNTNYHYLVPDLSAMTEPAFRANGENAALKFKRGERPVWIGPFTFLKLSKGVSEKDFEKFFLALVDTYREIIGGFKYVQIDEPAFATDLSEAEIQLIQEGYQRLKNSETEITLMTYYGDVDFMDELLSLPVSAIGLDLVHGPGQIEYLIHEGFPENKTLIAGIVDGRNVWKNDIAASVALLKKLAARASRLDVSNAGPLYHLPVSLALEKNIAPALQKRLSFAAEKLSEIRMIADCFNGKKIPKQEQVRVYGRDLGIQKHVKSLSDEDFIKGISFQARRKVQDQLLKLPLFPTTTIGSFPQTEEIRVKRAAFRRGELSKKEYRKFIQNEIERVIRLQEELGLDVFVHGEFERTDMVEFFAEKLKGIATTESGWILSYGTRAYRPPIIYGDVSRPSPMTIEEIKYAQSKTKKPVKGMLTGPVTLIAWSFCREDIPVEEVAYEIALALREEIRDYEKAGIRVVQVDEPAFREKAPLKKREWPEYFKWAVRSFNLTTNTDPRTQIHSHMCYSDFGPIIDTINAMDFDVISIEASRSKGDIIGAFEHAHVERQIGLGVWDIHSPAVPTAEKMQDIVKRSLKEIPKENFWLNPDCGLKTRDWPEVEASLKNLVAAAQALRNYPLKD